MSEHLVRINFEIKDDELIAVLAKARTMSENIRDTLVDAAESTLPDRLRGTVASIKGLADKLAEASINVQSVNDKVERLKSLSQEISKVSGQGAEANMKYLHSLREELRDLMSDLGLAQDNIQEQILNNIKLQKIESNVQSSINKAVGLRAQTYQDLLEKTNSIFSITGKHAKQLMDNLKWVEENKEFQEEIEEKYGIALDKLIDQKKQYEAINNLLGEGNALLKKAPGEAQKLLGVFGIMGDVVKSNFTSLAMVSFVVDTIIGQWQQMANGYEQVTSVATTFTDVTGEYIHTGQAMVTMMQGARNETILLSEAITALSGVLMSGYIDIEASTEQIARMAELTAETSRAMRSNEQATARLIARYQNLGAVEDDLINLQSVLINGTRSARLNQEQANIVIDRTAKLQMRLNSVYQSVDRQTGDNINGTIEFAQSMMSLAEAARQVGADATEAMNLFADSMERPIEYAALLGSAINIRDPGDRLTAIGARASELLGVYEDLAANNPIGAAAYLEAFNVSEGQLRSLAEEYRTLEEEARLLIDASSAQLSMEEAIAQARENRQSAQADADKAEQARIAALTTALTSMQRAWDALVTVFGQAAIALEPILTFFANLVSHPVGRWFFWIGVAVFSVVPAINAFAAALAFMKVQLMANFQAIGRFISWLWSGTAASNAASASINRTAVATHRLNAAGAQSAATGGGLRGLGEALRGFFNSIGGIKLKDVAMFAAIVAVMVAAFAGLAYAANVLPENRALEIAATSVALVGVMYSVKLLGEASKQALKGIVPFAVASAALMGAFIAIGYALTWFNEGDALKLFQIVLALIPAFGLVALMGIPQVAGVVVLGAIAMGVAAAAMMGAFAALGFAITLFGPEQAWQLASTMLPLGLAMAGLAATAPFVVAGAVGAAGIALTGVLLLGGFAALGAAVNMFGPEQSSQLYDSIMNLIFVSAGLAAIGLMAPLAIAGAYSLIPIGIALGIGLSALSVGMAAIARSGFVEFLNDLGDALSGITPEMADTLGDMGNGLTQFASALNSGGLVNLFGGGFAARARELATSMRLLAEPISMIASIGENVGNAFRAIASGIREFINVMNEVDTGGLFSDGLAGQAEELAGAMATIVGPMQDIVNANSSAIKSSAQEASDVMAEELSSNLAMKIADGEQGDDRIVEVLERIESKLDNISIGDEIDDRIAEIAGALRTMMEDSIFGGGGRSTNDRLGYGSV